MKQYKLSNRGSALPTVIMVMLVVMTFAGIVLSLVTSQTKSEKFYENDITALHAAEAGLNLYLWDLNEDGGTPVALDTVITYPESNPTAAFTLKLVTDTLNKKVVQSTGWMLNDPSIKRIIEVSFAKRTYAQYIYFSDNDPYDPTDKNKTIWWSTSDKCYGPYHSNTYLCIMGKPTFYSDVSYVEGIKYYTGPSVDIAKFTITPVKRSAIPYKSNNTELMNIAKNGGYYYEGRTCIRLNENGTITILNPYETPTLQTKNLPPNGVIYVNGTVCGDPRNHKFDNANGNVFIYGTLNGRLTVAAKGDIYITGYDPTKNTIGSSTPSWGGIKYKNTTFSLIGNKYTPNVETGGDMLGLIADQNVEILTYGWFNGNSIDSSVSPMNVFAAIFAINGSFINSFQMDYPSIYEPHTYPESPGVLIVRGAIIQKKRGAVARGDSSGTSSGYSKDYAHDARMLYEEPPYFLDPSGTGWEILEWNEIN